MIRRTVLPLLLHTLLTLLVAVWFGIWFLGPAVLILIGVDDPRNIFGEPFTLAGCGVLVLGWLYFVFHVARCGDLPAWHRLPGMPRESGYDPAAA